MSQTAAVATTDTPPAPTVKPEAAKPVAKAEVKKAEEAKPIAALLAAQWKARESGVFFNTHEVVPNAGTPLAHLTRPEFWGNVSQKMKPGDTIIAYPRDGAWYADLVVWDAGQNWAHVSVKWAEERPKFDAIAGVADDFVIARDPIDGIVIKRRATGAKVKGNFSSHEDARRWIMDHQSALRR